MAHTEAAGMPSPPDHAERARVLGLPVDRLTMDAAVAWVGAAVAGDCLRRVVVTNANKSWLAHQNAQLRRHMEAADLVVAEYATAWAARRLGVAGVDHVGGLTLMMRLLTEAPVRGWTVYLLGAQAAVVAALAERLRGSVPAVDVVGTHHGYLDEAAETAVREELVELRPDLLFVAMGSPRQETFIATLPPDAARVAIGVGGSFDVLAGVKKDAPAWMRGRGLEWLFRLGQDPLRLWRRYLVTNPWFVVRVYREAWWPRSG